MTKAKFIGVVLLLVTAALGAAQSNRSTAPQQPSVARSRQFRQRYIQLTNSWAKDIEFTEDESHAMEAGKKVEDQMVRGPDDPVARQIRSKGEPSWQSVSSVYPGKILDRTLLGTWSDPKKPLGNYTNEFAIFWNGAIAAHFTQGRHNTVVEFHVGPNNEFPGRVRKNYSSIGYERGYLPIVTDTYETDGVRYTQTAFAWKPDDGQTDGWDIAFVSFEATNTTQIPKQATIRAQVKLMDERPVAFADGYITDPDGAILLAADENAKFKDGALVWQFDLPPGGQSRQALCKIPYLPDSRHLVKTASESEFSLVHHAAVVFWQGLLDSGAKIQTPEDRINNVWRALLLQNFILADGPRFTYGSGLEYNDNTYPYENGFATHTFAMYGHPAYADALQEWFIKMAVTPQGAGRKYQNRRAMVLHHLLENYRLTGLTDLWDRHKDDYLRVADEIIADRHTTMDLDEHGQKPLHYGLLPPDKPGVDIQAATQTVYVLGHSITNCQGLSDLGRFLLVTKIDPERGQRYLNEAADFRECILTAMNRAAIKLPDRPPFVDLQTLYFKTTKDYGPNPYDDLGPSGRLQGAYYHYWVDMEFHYNFFNPDDEPAHWLADYVHARNGFVLGLTRARTQWGNAKGRINNVYDGGYYNFRLRCNDIDEFLLGLYAKLAFGMSRYTFVASEGSPFTGYNTHDGGFVGIDYSFPNSAANADTLLMLRNALVLEELKNNIETGTIFLMKGAPKSWLAPGKRTSVEKLPTYFGPISFTIEGTDKDLRATIDPLPGNWQHIELSFRHPIKAVTINGEKLDTFDPQTGLLTIPHRPGRMTIEAQRAD